MRVAELELHESILHVEPFAKVLNGSVEGRLIPENPIAERSGSVRLIPVLSHS
jgi:hypothetical protein